MGNNCCSCQEKQKVEEVHEYFKKQEDDELGEWEIGEESSTVAPSDQGNIWRSLYNFRNSCGQAQIMAFDDTGDERMLKAMMRGSESAIFRKHQPRIFDIEGGNSQFQSPRDKPAEYDTALQQICMGSPSRLLPFSVISHARTQDVLYEGEVLKYKPGVKISYIHRWGQVTKGEFRYYRNNWTANCWLSRPLMMVSFRNIAAVRKVKVKVQEDQELRREHGKLYQFQIFLKHDSEYSTYHHLNTSYAVPDTCSSYLDGGIAAANSLGGHNHRALSSPYRRPGSVRSASPGSIIREQRYELQTPVVKRERVKRVQKNHLMPSPSRMRSPITTRVSRALSPCSPVPESVYETPCIQERSQTGNGATSYRGAAAAGEEEILVKSPSAWIQSTGGAATWSNREIEWYFAEKRYLFATRSSQERDRWIGAIAAIIDYNRSKF